MIRSIGDSWQTRHFPNEVGSIGEKVAKEWLLERGYEVYSFLEIIWQVADIRMRTLAAKSGRKYAISEKGRDILERRKQFLRSLFGESFEDMKEYEKAIREMSREAKIELARHYKRVGIGPDFIVKKNDDISFVEVKVNQAQLKKWQKASLQIAEEHGFKTMILRMNIEISVGEDIQLTEP